MNSFFRLLFGIMGGGVLVLGRPSVALANGGHVSFGDIHIPMVAVWVGGGVLGAFLLFFFIVWGLSSRAKRRSQQGEMDNNLQKAEREKK